MGVVYLIELFENMFLVSFVNIDFVVGDGDCDDVGVDVMDLLGGDYYLGFWFGIDNGVVNKIGDCFGELVLIFEDLQVVVVVYY